MAASKSAADKAPPIWEAFAFPVMRTQCCRMRFASSGRLICLSLVIACLYFRLSQGTEKLLVIHAAHDDIKQERCRSSVRDPMIKCETKHTRVTDSECSATHYRVLSDS